MNSQMALSVLFTFFFLFLYRKFKMKFIGGKRVVLCAAVCDDGAVLGVCLLLSDISNVINRYLSL